MTDDWDHLTSAAAEIASVLDVTALDDADLVDLSRRLEAELAERVREHGLEPTPRPLRVPADDIDGFIEWVETEYTGDRWSGYHTSRENPPSVTLWSAEHPVLYRFIEDVRPHLYEHGLVIETVDPDFPFYAEDDDQLHRVHAITAVPMAYAAAAYHDLICDRLACQRLGVDYCDDCEKYMGVS